VLTLFIYWLLGDMFRLMYIAVSRETVTVGWLHCAVRFVFGSTYVRLLTRHRQTAHELILCVCARAESVCLEKQRLDMVCRNCGMLKWLIY
jgi:hypothetical protein